jgi:hypothetical protein
MRSYWEEKVAATVYKTENTAVGIRCGDYDTLLSAKVGTNFAKMRRSLADSGHGVCLCCVIA